MLCRNPHSAQGSYYPCGQCLPCRLNRRRLWTHRILLETKLHGDNSFITLTYNEAHKPLCGSLVKKDYQDFLKRLRKQHGKFRYFLVGEYGDHSWRPHYHAILFGVPTCRHGQTDIKRSYCCAACSGISTIWGKGNVYLGAVTQESVQYVCGYVVKKMTKKDDPRLLGRPPEFSSMSLKPGIGHDFMHEVASTYLSFDLETRQADIPVSLSHGRSAMPLGRYLRRKLRTMVGMDEKPPENAPNTAKEKMHNLLQDKIASTPPGEFWSIKEVLTGADKGRAASLEYHHKLKAKRGSQ